MKNIGNLLASNGNNKDDDKLREIEEIRTKKIINKFVYEFITDKKHKELAKKSFFVEVTNGVRKITDEEHNKFTSNVVETFAKLHKKMWTDKNAKIKGFVYDFGFST